MLTSKHRRDVFPQPMPELRHPSQSAAPLLIPADHEGLALHKGAHGLTPSPPAFTTKCFLHFHLWNYVPAAGTAGDSKTNTFATLTSTRVR